MWASVMMVMNLQVTKLSKLYVYLSSVALQLCWGYERWIWGMWEVAFLYLAPKWFWRESGKPRETSVTTAITDQYSYRMPPECVGDGLLLCHVSWLTRAYKMSTNDLNLSGTVDSHKIEKGVFQCTMKILQIRSLLFFIPSSSSCSFSVYTDPMLHR